MDLSSITLMMPIKVESLDRLYNIKSVLGYLNHHFKTNIKIIEVYTHEPSLDFIDTYTNLSIDYNTIRIGNDDPFHKTKYLNTMLYSTTTELVAVYDCDILLPVSSFSDITSSLLRDEFDFIYPFKFGKGQKQLFYSNWYTHPNKEIVYQAMLRFLETFDLKYLDNDLNFIRIHDSYYGHSVFGKTSTYKQAFGENEHFISYGPEDEERAYRFGRLGYRLKWWDDYVYHIEHQRTADSSIINPYFTSNSAIFEYIKSLSKEDLVSYYKKKLEEKK